MRVLEIRKHSSNKIKSHREGTFFFFAGTNFIYIIYNDKTFIRALFLFILTESLTFALAGMNGLLLSFQHRSGRGLPLTTHSSRIVSPTRPYTFAKGTLNSGRAIRQSLIITNRKKRRKEEENFKYILVTVDEQILITFWMDGQIG